MARHQRIKSDTKRLSLADVERAICFRQPALKVVEQEGRFFISGEFHVSDGPSAGGSVATFSVGIIVSVDYPESEPIVFETGSRIPLSVERHMYSSGQCCTCIWEEWLATSSDTSFGAFCDGPLLNFFVSQVVFEETGEWPFGDRAHGIEGFKQAAAVMLNLTKSETPHAERFLQAVVLNELKGHIDCPCGSGKRLRDCHQSRVSQIRAATDRQLAIRLHERLLRSKRLSRIAA